MDEAGRDKLWQQYSKTHDTELRDELILEYAQLVKLVAGRLSMYLGYNVEYDDLVGYGIFGLIDAIDKYDYLFRSTRLLSVKELLSIIYLLRSKRNRRW